MLGMKRTSWRVLAVSLARVGEVHHSCVTHDSVNGFTAWAQERNVKHTASMFANDFYSVLT